MISAAFSAARTFSTRSTALAVVWFWNLSRMVAAVKSGRQLALSLLKKKILTSQSFKQFILPFERNCSPVQSLQVFGVQVESSITILDDEIVIGRGHVDVAYRNSEQRQEAELCRLTSCPVAVVHGLVRGDLDGSCVELGGSHEVACLVCGISLRLEVVCNLGL
jgi:hypothetical protein